MEESVTSVARMRTCPICSKEFLRPYENIYRHNFRDRRGTVDYCSWACYRKADKELQESRKRRAYRTVKHGG